MLTAALLAIPLRKNLPVALACTLYTNPFTIVPLYLFALLARDPDHRREPAASRAGARVQRGAHVAVVRRHVGLGGRRWASRCRRASSAGGRPRGARLDRGAASPGARMGRPRLAAAQRARGAPRDTAPLRTGAVSGPSTPSSSRRMRSARAASVGSCVTMTRLVPEVAVESEHQVEHRLGGVPVEVAGRLVGQHAGRPRHQRARQRRALALAARQFARACARAGAPSPTALEHRRRRALAPRAGVMRRMSSGIATFSSAVNSGSR